MSWRLGPLLLSCLLLGACALEDRIPQRVGTEVGRSVVFTDLSPRGVSSRGGGDVTGSVGSAEETTPASDVFLASGSSAEQTAADDVAVASGESVRLNFDNADIAAVVRSILSDTLGLTYSMDARVAGQVTLASVRPVPREELVGLLESLLRMNGAALVRDGDLYRVVLESDAVGAGVIDTDIERIEPGHGISVIPLRYISAQTMSQLIEGFASRPGMVRVERSRNLVLVLGSAGERAAAVRTVLSFDVDWMRDQSAGIFPLQHASPEAIIPELERVFDSKEGGLGSNVVQFQPMTRLKAVLAIAKQPELIQRVRTWIERLDRENEEVGSRVHVYRVQYREARDLVRVLLTVFGNGGGAAGPAAEVAPGATPVTSEVPGADGSTATADASGDPTATAPPVAAAADSEPAEDPAGGGSNQFRISADTTNNSLIVVTDNATYRKVLVALRELDRPPLQVAINVTIAEVRLNDELRYGVQYFVKSKTVGLDDDEGSVGLFNAVAKTIGRELPGFNFVLGADKSPDIIISAIDQITDVQVLSSPSLVVLENQPATLQVGEQVPVATRQAQSVTDSTAPIVNQIEFRNVGIILKVVPRIGENGVVTMSIEQEISAVARVDSATLTPTISQRRINSAISVNSGQTVLLGGLISERGEADKSGIPVLHSIEALGDLFGTKKRKGERTELIVLIRPVVVRNGTDAAHVAEELRARMWSMGEAGRLIANE